MLNIINDIINLSKTESGSTDVFISATNINEQLEYILNSFRPIAEEKNLKISLINSSSENDVLIRTDKEKIYAVLTNLVSNAIKFTAAGSIEFGYKKKRELA